MNARVHSSLHDLHVRTGLPKTTVFRLLDTLKSEGLVREMAGHGYYQLTPKVRELSAGVTERMDIINLAMPCMIRSTRNIRWPLAIATLEGFEMVVRFSTMPYSPLAVRPTTYGRRHSLTCSAVGLAYLAHCPEAERVVLLPDGMDDDIRWQMREVREQGYALRRGRSRSDSSTCAVPVMRGQEVLAALSLTTFAGSMTGALLEQVVPELRNTVAEILEGHDGWREAGRLQNEEAEAPAGPSGQPIRP